MKGYTFFFVFILTINGASQTVSKQSIDFAQDTSRIFSVVETMPEFSGGDSKLFEYLSKNIKIPKSYVDNGVKGKLYFEFVVEKDGSILKLMNNDNAELYRNVALALNNMPIWTSGKQNGEAVRVKMISGFSCINLR